MTEYYGDVDSLTTISTFSNIYPQPSFVNIDSMSIVSSFVDFIDQRHIGFYVTNGAIQKCNVIQKYRMNGKIVPNSTRNIQKVPFVAKQSLIFPDDVNADARFALDRSG